jgi:hypothetical protein
VGWSGFYRVVGGYFRRKRTRWVTREFADCRTVVDLGGTPQSWPRRPFPAITLVNLLPAPEALPQGFTYVNGDALHTPLDGAFDLAFSNSVIEHVGPRPAQECFAGEMFRLGRRLYCQTPNRWFPVEPHFLTLFLHWLPRSWFRPWMHRWLTINGLRGKAWEPIYLLSRREVRELFPGCNLRTERFLGLPKSFVVWR